MTDRSRTLAGYLTTNGSWWYCDRGVITSVGKEERKEDAVSNRACPRGTPVAWPSVCSCTRVSASGFTRYSNSSTFIDSFSGFISNAASVQTISLIKNFGTFAVVHETLARKPSNICTSSWRQNPTLSSDRSVQVLVWSRILTFCFWSSIRIIIPKNVCGAASFRWHTTSKYPAVQLLSQVYDVFEEDGWKMAATHIRGECAVSWTLPWQLWLMSQCAVPRERCHRSAAFLKRSTLVFFKGFFLRKMSFANESDIDVFCSVKMFLVPAFVVPGRWRSTRSSAICIVEDITIILKLWLLKYLTFSIVYILPKSVTDSNGRVLLGGLAVAMLRGVVMRCMSRRRWRTRHVWRIAHKFCLNREGRREAGAQRGKGVLWSSAAGVLTDAKLCGSWIKGDPLYYQDFLYYQDGSLRSCNTDCWNFFLSDTWTWDAWRHTQFDIKLLCIIGMLFYVFVVFQRGSG